jgi:hypothetical protein
MLINESKSESQLKKGICHDKSKKHISHKIRRELYTTMELTIRQVCIVYVNDVVETNLKTKIIMTCCSNSTVASVMCARYPDLGLSYY